MRGVELRYPVATGPRAMWDRLVEQQAATPSPYSSDDPETVSAEAIGQIPFGRLGSTAEVASVVTFLPSDASSYLTGVDVGIAGGAR